MSQRRSRNKRSLLRRSYNASGILNDNTSIFDNDDPLWADRTILRPSTSFYIPTNDSTILDPDSNIEGSLRTENLSKYLPRSDNSKFIEEIVKKNHEQRKSVQSASNHTDQATESESDHEFQRKRSKFGVTRKQANKTDKSNAFLKVLEETTDTTRNVTNLQIPSGHESESTIDESKTIKRPRPRLFRNNKQIRNDIENDFDDVLNNSHPSRIIQSLRSPLRRRSNENEKVEVPAQKIKKSSEKIYETLVSKNISVRELRNRTVNTTPTKNMIHQSVISDNSITEVFKKRRPALFSQEKKDANIKNNFDAVLDSDAESDAITVQNKEELEKTTEVTKNDGEDDNESESSSIPANIRRTKSQSFFQGRKSVNVHNTRDESITEESKGGLMENRSTRKSMSNQTSDASKNKANKLNVSNQNAEADKSSSESDILKRSKARFSIDDESSEVDMINISTNKTKSEDENIEGFERQSTRKSNSQKSKNISNDEDDLIDGNKSPIVSNRTRSRLLQRNSNAKNDIVYDQISYSDKSANKQSSTNSGQKSQNTSRNKSSQKSNSSKSLSQPINQSKKNQSSNTSVLQENNSQEDVDDSENSSIPKNIRRTRSTFFHSRKGAENINVFDDVLNNENLPNTEEPKSLNSINESFNKSTSNLRDFNRSKPKVLLRRLPRKVFDSSNESSKENRSTPSPQKSRNDLKRSHVDNKSRNSNIVDESVDKAKERSVSTSNDGTPVHVGKQATNNLATPTKSISSHTTDDLLHTPDPAQSTLVPTGKPVTRITQFSFRAGSKNVTERTPLPPHNKILEVIEREKIYEDDQVNLNVEDDEDIELNDQQNANGNNQVDDRNIDDRQIVNRECTNNNIEVDEDEEINVTDEDEEVNDYPLLTRQLNEIPYDTDRPSSDEDVTPFLSDRPIQLVNKADNVATFTDAEFAAVRKKLDAFKKMTEAQMKRETEERETEARRKAKIQTKLKRLIAQQEAEKKKKSKKPIDKAYLVDGKVYKQPKLPKPKYWVTNRLYEHLWKCMKPKYGLDTRIKSEKLILQLSDLVAAVTRRKMYTNYKAELDDILVLLAKNGIIKTRNEFYRFCSRFMPHSFKIKAVPMVLPGNIENIPYDPMIVNKPILEDRSIDERSNNNEGESESAGSDEL